MNGKTTVAKKRGNRGKVSIISFYLADLVWFNSYLEKVGLRSFLG